MEAVGQCWSADEKNQLLALSLIWQLELALAVFSPNGRDVSGGGRLPGGDGARRRAQVG